MYASDEHDDEDDAAPFADGGFLELLVQDGLGVLGFGGGIDGRTGHGVRLCELDVGTHQG
jgi:hypothetical protein